MAKFHRNASMIILLALLASGCLAPLSNSFTARSLGTGKIGLDGGVLSVRGDIGAISAFKIAIGLSSDFDFGVQIETGSMGVFGKYSFVNNKERGFSLAGVLGAGESSGFYTYGGPVLSYKAKSFEPYIVGRFNYVHYGEPNPFGDDWGEAGTYTYLQFTLGSIFWLTQSIGLNVEGSAFGAISVCRTLRISVPRPSSSWEGSRSAFDKA